MTGIDPALAPMLAHAPEDVFRLLLVFARVAGAVMLLPGFSDEDLPVMVRLAVALALTVLLAPVLGKPTPLPAAPLDLARLLAAETATGLWLGFLAQALALALPAAGDLAAGALGLSNVLQPDSELGPGASALATALRHAVPALILAANLDVPLLEALRNSYDLIPVGHILPAPSLHTVLPIVARSFALTVRLAAPFLLAGLVWSGLLGLAARLVPRLQVYFAAMPGQVVAGLLLLAGLAPMLLAFWTRAMTSGFTALAGH